jgi:hypothetical protein
MPKAPRKLTPKSRPDPTAPASPHVSFNSRAELVEYVPGAARLLGVPPSPNPGPLRNLRKYVYHLSQDQIEALRAPHDSTITPENFPWPWSSGVFERLETGKRAVPRGTVKVTVEMPGAYSDIEMPRDLLVRDDAELAKIALEEENSEDESSGLSDLEDEDTDSELSELEDEMFEGPRMEEMREWDDESDGDSELSELDDEKLEALLTQVKKLQEAKKAKAQEAQEAQENDYDGDSDLTDLDDDEQEDDEE